MIKREFDTLTLTADLWTRFKLDFFDYTRMWITKLRNTFFVSDCLNSKLNQTGTKKKYSHLDFGMNFRFSQNRHTRHYKTKLIFFLRKTNL